MSKPLRLAMPFTAAVIDECRAAFGAEGIDAAIRGGMQGLPTFWARENGKEIGTKAPAGRGVTGAQMQLGSFNPIKENSNARRNPV